MALYSLSRRISIFTLDAANTELRTASTDRARLLHLNFCASTGVATGYNFGLGRPAAIGVTPTTPVTFLADDPADPAATTTLTTAGWGTPPTVPAAFFRRFMCSDRGLTTFFTFPRGLAISVSSSLVLWNVFKASDLVEVSWTLDE
jgi:hypothetical protein